jgi:2-amino-4-hydroxy-6-hydroxymethyldihydropteridine diphosphokinase
MAVVYLGLGTNLGNRTENMETALKLIDENIGRIICVSSYFTSEAIGFISENSFLNAVAKIETDVLPVVMLNETQRIEREMGRTKKSVNGNYSDRIIDIDILLYDNIVIDTQELKIPHPFITERDFVFKPLSEIAPGLTHPVSGIRFSDLK